MGLNPKKADQSLKQAPPLTSFAGPLCGAVDFCHWAGGGDKESGREASSQINTAIHNNGARVCATPCTFVCEGVHLREGKRDRRSCSCSVPLLVLIAGLNNMDSPMDQGQCKCFGTT